MSANNTILVVATRKGNGQEFRVRHVQAAEMIDWDERTNDYTRDSEGFPTSDDDVRIQNVRIMMDRAELFTDRKQAMNRDFAIEQSWLDEGLFVEYGVC